MKSPLEQFDIVNVKSFFTALVDFSLNNIIGTFFINYYIILIYLFIFNNKFNINTFLCTKYNWKWIIIFIISLIKQQAG